MVLPCHAIRPICTIATSVKETRNKFGSISVSSPSAKVVKSSEQTHMICHASAVSMTICTPNLAQMSLLCAALVISKTVVILQLLMAEVRKLSQKSLIVVIANPPLS